MDLRTPCLMGLLLAASFGRAQDTGCDCWIEPDSTWTFLGNPNSWSYPSIWHWSSLGSYHYPVALPFTFDFFGEERDSVFINVSGTLSFDAPYPGGYPVNFPFTGRELLAGYWSDISLRMASSSSPDSVNKVAIKVTPTALHVSWEHVQFTHQGTTYDWEKLNSFQMIITNGNDPVLPEGNNVGYCFRSIRWSTGQSGPGSSDGFGGEYPAVVGANRGDGVDYMQVGHFAYPDSSWQGRTVWSGVGWLNGRRLAFDVSNSTVRPFFSTTECDTVEVEVGATYHYVIVAHRGGPVPVGTAAAWCPTLANYAIEQVDEVDGSEVITVAFTPTTDEVGFHTHAFQALAGTAEPSLFEGTIKVVPATGTGIAGEPMAHDLAAFPNPAGNRATLTWPAGNGPRQVELIAMNGAVVAVQKPTGNTNRMELDLSKLPLGVYTVRVVNEDAIHTLKLVRAGE